MLSFEKYPGKGRELLGTGKMLKREFAREVYEILYQLTGQDSCAYCGNKLLESFERWQVLAIDHVIPDETGKQKGIRDEWLQDLSNAVFSCVPCNRYKNKYQLLPAEACPESPAAFFDLRDRVFTERRELAARQRAKDLKGYQSHPWLLPLDPTGPARPGKGKTMSFRDREKERLLPIKPELWSGLASGPGEYNGNTYEFCIHERCSAENLHASIRDAAIGYFGGRGIRWHDGRMNASPGDVPSNHLCCSQSFCVNSWFPYVSQPELLKQILDGLGYPVEEVLPMEVDIPLASGHSPCVSFEWIGIRNYLHETQSGRVVSDNKRARGRYFTSADFAFRFRRRDQKIQIVLGEWKYTEDTKLGDMRFSSSGTDRLAIYRPELQREDCQIRLPQSIPLDALFYDPFDQLMRLQLLASAMEREREMGAEIVSVIHVAPGANKKLLETINSPQLSGLGTDVHQVWSRLVRDDRFRPCCTEDLLPVLIGHSQREGWAEYMKLRYLGMK